MASKEMTVKQRDWPVAILIQAHKEFGFSHISDTGIKPLGTIGAPPQILPAARAQASRHFVLVVVGADRMTFQGKDTTWEKLPELLAQIPDREHTVLEYAMASKEMTVKQRDRAVAILIQTPKDFGFSHVSDTGIKPLGTMGTPPQILPAAPADGDVLKAKEISDALRPLMDGVYQAMKNKEVPTALRLIRSINARAGELAQAVAGTQLQQPIKAIADILKDIEQALAKRNAAKANNLLNTLHAMRPQVKLLIDMAALKARGAN